MQRHSKGKVQQHTAKVRHRKVDTTAMRTGVPPKHVVLQSAARGYTGHAGLACCLLPSTV